MTLVQRRSLDQSKRQAISKNIYGKLIIDNLSKMSDSEKRNYAIDVPVAEYDRGVRELVKLIEGAGSTLSDGTRRAILAGRSPIKMERIAPTGRILVEENNENEIAIVSSGHSHEVGGYETDRIPPPSVPRRVLVHDEN